LCIQVENETPAPRSTILTSSSSSSLTLPPGLNTTFHKTPPLTPPFVVSHVSLNEKYYIQNAVAILREYIETTNIPNNKKSFENIINNEMVENYVPIESLSEYFDVIGVLENIQKEEVDNDETGDSREEIWVKCIRKWFK
jgi:hypothetical protein